MAFNFSIPTPTGPQSFNIDQGTSLLFVGANGGGKTRLAVKIENDLADHAHRISAHRALTLNPSVPKIDEISALRGLRIGNSDKALINIINRDNARWSRNAAVSLLNDFDHLIQSLFAEQANTSFVTHKNIRAGSTDAPLATKFEKLQEIWGRLLPHRKLEITGDNIEVYVPSSGTKYNAGDMSDGERAIFYLIGQTLAAAQNSLIIFDEPELHVHRSIMSRLWDEIEAARPDCAIVLISHDLEFVASREGQKYVLRDYSISNGWTIEAVPQESGFTEEITTLILGSRRPVLFVEGEGGSLDRAIYRACYPDWTIIPRGSCEEVIHAVITMRANTSLTRITCAGIVDADAYDTEEIQFLEKKGISVLPVSEIENLFLIPNVINAIATNDGYDGDSLQTKIASINNELFSQVRDIKNQLPIVMRYCRRRIDRTLKKIDLSQPTDVAALSSEYATKTAALDILALAKLASESIQEAVAKEDVFALLKWYDNKGILGIACKARNTSKAQFEQWIVRALRNDTAPIVSGAIRDILPKITPN